MKVSRLGWFSLVLILISLVLAVIYYPKLPDPVPTHWNAAGEVDGWTAKPWGVWIMPLIAVGMWLMSLVLPVISPKGFKLDSARRAYDIIWFVLIGFMVAVQFVSYLTAIGQGPGITTTVNLMMGGLFIVLGNYLAKFPKNFFVGIRTPWTLASDEVWNRTHRLGSWTFMLAGVLIVISAFFYPETWFFITVVMLAAFIPLIYSLVLYKKLEGFSESDE